MSRKVDHKTSYVQNESIYLYCSQCGRKEYRLGRVGLPCNAYNSAPATYPQQHCLGTLTLTTTTLAARSNNDQNEDRVSS